MSNPRKITVEREDPRWQEYDREVCIQLWSNQHQSTAFRLSREEFRNLRSALDEFEDPQWSVE